MKEHLGPNLETMGAKKPLRVVIPVFHELDSGNLLRLLQSFNRQTVNSYGLVFVVNNRAESAINNDLIYTENKRTVDALHGTSSQTNGYDGLVSNLTNALRAKGVQITIIDKTAGIERNMGLIRNLGLDEATRSLEAEGLAPTDGIIANLDADTVVGATYVEKILSEFANPEVETVFAQMDYLCPVGSIDLFRSTYFYQWEQAMYSFLRTFRHGYVRAGSPQIIARASSYTTNRFSLRETLEDFDLSRDLSKSTHYTWGKIWIHTADRSRPDSFDGKDRQSSEFSDTQRILHNVKIYGVASEHALNSRFSAFLVKKRILLGKDSLDTILSQNHIERTARNNNSDLLSIIDRYFLNTAALMPHDVVEHMVDSLSKNLPPSETLYFNRALTLSCTAYKARSSAYRSFLIGAVKTVFERGKLDDGVMNLFFKDNPWFNEYLAALPERFSSSEEALQDLEKEFPDWFLPFEETPLLLATAKLMGLVGFIREAQSHPQKCPLAAEIFKNDGTAGNIYYRASGYENLFRGLRP